jgi:hypothetical protein
MSTPLCQFSNCQCQGRDFYPFWRLAIVELVHIVAHPFTLKSVKVGKFLIIREILFQ